MPFFSLHMTATTTTTTTGWKQPPSRLSPLAQRPGKNVLSGRDVQQRPKAWLLELGIGRLHLAAVCFDTPWIPATFLCFVFSSLLRISFIAKVDCALPTDADCSVAQAVEKLPGPFRVSSTFLEEFWPDVVALFPSQTDSFGAAAASCLSCFVRLLPGRTGWRGWLGWRDTRTRHGHLFLQRQIQRGGPTCYHASPVWPAGPWPELKKKIDDPFLSFIHFSYAA